MKRNTISRPWTVGAVLLMSLGHGTFAPLLGAPQAMSTTEALALKPDLLFWDSSNKTLSISTVLKGWGPGSGDLGLRLEGIATVGKAPEDPKHKNSFWVSLSIENQTSDLLLLEHIEVGFVPKPGSTLDGLSFGALSQVAFESLGKTDTDNPWAFKASITGGDMQPRAELAVAYPSKANSLRYHSFIADNISGSAIKTGETIHLDFLVTQNGPADIAGLSIALIPMLIPESRPAGVAMLCLLGMVATIGLRKW